MNYLIAPTGSDLIHYGKGHDDNPPGRGSGRYAWGSGSKGAKEKETINAYKRTIKIASGSAAVLAGTSIALAAIGSKRAYNAMNVGNVFLGEQGISKASSIIKNTTLASKELKSTATMLAGMAAIESMMYGIYRIKR
jgi:hypothetical protein